MKNENDEERGKKQDGLFKTEDNHVSDYMGKITDASDSVMVPLAELLQKRAQV